MMSAHQFLLTTLALLLMDALSLVPCRAAPAAGGGGGELILNPSPMTDDLDMAILRRAMRQGNECDSREEIRDLCQRCAKVTRSTVAYPLCCQPRDNPRIWCMKFLAFGISK